MKHSRLFISLWSLFLLGQTGWAQPATAGKGNPGHDKTFILEAANQIDRLVFHQIKMRQQKVPPMATDEMFIRRTYLGAVGRIPTYDEALMYLGDDAKDKRYDQINSLLNSEGYKSHTFHFWADLLRAKDNFDDGLSGRPYLIWIRENIEKNTPYDKMVRELITAEGGMWEKGNGSVGYYIRDRGMPLDNMANTTRIFLGTQIACAQCHDHPHEDWKQMEFFQMAAFTHGLRSLRDYNYMKATKSNFDESYLEQDPVLRGLEQQMRYAFIDSYIRGPGKGLIPLPKDYKYKDAKPGETVKARTMMGKRVRNMSDRPMDNGREKLVDWMTAKENPTFTKVIANRLWKRVMGTALVEPLDNFRKDTKSSNPELMAYLEKLMQQVQFDLKSFQRILFNTRTFRMGPNPTLHDPTKPYYFNGRQLGRMSAEQIWDSLLTLTIPSPDTRKSGRFNYDIHFRGKTIMSGKKNMQDLQKEIAGLSPEGYWDYMKNLTATFKSDSGVSGGGNMMMMSEKYGGYDNNFMRASELNSPTPPNHFLRKFGQSDRNVIDGSSREGDVTQVLSLLNGHMESNILNNEAAVLHKNLKRAKSIEEKIKVIFMSVLTRYPTNQEMTLMFPVVKDAWQDTGYKNVMAALLNTSEFIYIQ